MDKNAPKKLHVLIIVNRLYEWSQNFITRELVELNSQGVEVYIGARQIVERDDLTEAETSLQANFILIPENPFTPRYLWRHFKFEVKHPVNSFRAWMHFFSFGHKRPLKIGRSLVCFFRAAAIAEIIITQKINLIHAHFLTAPTETALYLSTLTQIPFGCTAHAMDIYKDNSGIQKKILQAKYIATCTMANARHLKNLNAGVSSKIFTNYHGIQSTNRDHKSTSQDYPFLFLAVGRLTPKKGFSYLLEACKDMSMQGYHFKCRIVGRGPLEESLKTHIQQLNIQDRIELIGYFPPHKMAKIYESSHVLVVPSVIESNGDRDGLPNVCLEAMSYGLPIIGSNISGIPEGVSDNVNGKLVAPGDSRELSEAMVSFFDLDQRERMGKAAIHLVEEKFNLRNNVRQLKCIMEQFQKETCVA